MSSKGSTGNVIAALCSFCIPGLGQLIQGRILRAIIYFVLINTWFLCGLGWIIHIIATIDAATYKND